MLKPTRNDATLDHTSAAWCVAALVAGIIVAEASPHPDALKVVAVLLLLGAGWVVAATFLTHGAGDSLLCEVLRMPEDFHALGTVTLRLRLVNAHRRRPALFLQSHVRVRADGRMLPSPPFITPQLAPREAVELEWGITINMRGEHEIVDLRVRRCFPGSLVVCEQIFLLQHRMLALPATYRLQDRAVQMLIGRRHAAGRQHASPAAMEDFIGVRSYRAGDNPRHIHLVTSLRMPEYPMALAVREFEDPTDDDVCLVLDTGIAEDEEDRELLLYRHEKSLSFSVALCRLLCGRKYRVRFRFLDADGKACDLRIQHPVRDLARLEVLLARVKPTSSRKAVQQMLGKQAGLAEAAVLFISLREVAEERHQPRLAVLSVTPDWQMSLVREVVDS